MVSRDIFLGILLDIKLSNENSKTNFCDRSGLKYDGLISFDGLGMCIDVL